MDLGSIEQARRHLTRSIELSQATGTRIGVARGLEVFAAARQHHQAQPSRRSPLPPSREPARWNIGPVRTRLDRKARRLVMLESLT